MLWSSMNGGGEKSGHSPKADREKDKMPAKAKPPTPRIGMALGSGAARGWSHIGVLQRLNEAGIEPDVIAGTSVGALVGGCHAAGKLSELEEFALSLNQRRVFSLIDLAWRGSGVISGDKLSELLNEHLGDTRIEDLPRPFACVTTELATGHEIWLRTGNLVEAMRASYALPGVFEPMLVDNRWLIDGAVVNPIPVSVCRALGARIVIAVNLNHDVYSTGTIIQAPRKKRTADEETENGGKTGAASRLLGQLFGRAEKGPGITAVLVAAFNISQDRLARSRLAGDPPDIQIVPRAGDIGLFDFDQAAQSIQLGREAAERALPTIEEAIEVLR